MATYSIVDEGYVVTIVKSFPELFVNVFDDDLFLDQDNNIPLNGKNLKKELALYGMAWIYVEGENDWNLKIQKH
ncbi:MAG: hypothetical protein WC679_00950 [Bacteroidales bacterium]|jgi:hypothetical protein